MKVLPKPWDDPVMIFSDRRLNSVVAGLVLMGAVSGCRSARYQTAEQSTGTTTYAGTPVTPRNGSIPEPPSAFGPREPVPVASPDDSYESTAPSPLQEDLPSARAYDLGPALQSTPDESPVDDDLRFPEANRRPKPGRSLRSILSANRQKSGVEVRTAAEKMHPSAISASRTKKSLPTADARATAKLVTHPDAALRTKEQARKADLEPVQLSELPSLVSPPATAVTQTSIERQDLRIDRIALCNEVRGYDDVVQIDPQRIGRSNHFLVYVSLQNYRSRASQDGFQTLTRSQIELRTLAGDVVWRQALGNANDVAARPRHQYFLAHEIAFPAQIPAGNYILSLRVEDVLSEQSAVAQVAVRIHGGS